VAGRPVKQAVKMALGRAEKQVIMMAVGIIKIAITVARMPAAGMENRQAVRMTTDRHPLHPTDIIEVGGHHREQGDQGARHYRYDRPRRRHLRQ
jgi:hypothetical protein